MDLPAASPKVTLSGKNTPDCQPRSRKRGGLAKARHLRSTIGVEDDGLIPTGELSLAHVPAADADREALEEFCLTIDGYHGGRFTPDDLVTEAERVERSGLEQATLDELRIAAFTRQRELRWSSMDSGHYDERLVRSIRALVSEIRRRIDERAQNGS